MLEKLYVVSFIMNGFIMKFRWNVTRNFCLLTKIRRKSLVIFILVMLSAGFHDVTRLGDLSTLSLKRLELLILQRLVQVNVHSRLTNKYRPINSAIILGTHTPNII